MAWAKRKKAKLDARKQGRDTSLFEDYLPLTDLVHDAVMTLLLEEAADDFKEKHKEAVKTWQMWNARFDADPPPFNAILTPFQRAEC